MIIRVLENYGGRRTQEQRILPGEYDANDPRLFGLTDYLIECGVAEIIGDDVEFLPLPPVEGDDPVLSAILQDDLPATPKPHIRRSRKP